MKKVPMYIKNKMKYVTELSRKMDRAMGDVESWLYLNGLDPDCELRDGGGCSLEELEYGNDVTDALCERIESLLEGKNGTEETGCYSAGIRRLPNRRGRTDHLI